MVAVFDRPSMDGQDVSYLTKENAWKCIDVFLSMMGIRLDTGRILLVWLPLIAASVYVGNLAIEHDFLVEFAIAGWAFYYVGMTLMLGTGIKRWMIQKFGEERAWILFQMIQGLMFFNIGTGMSADTTTLTQSFGGWEFLKLKIIFCLQWA